jgi:predicted DNA-binding transcriptional regulator AlpA
VLLSLKGMSPLGRETGTPNYVYLGRATRRIANLEDKMSMRSQSKNLTNAEVAEMLGIRPNTLENWRGKGKGPLFSKLGEEKQAPIRYRESDVNAWLEERLCSSTSQYKRLPKKAKPDKSNALAVAVLQSQPLHA